MKYLIYAMIVVQVVVIGCGCRQADSMIFALFDERDSTPPQLLGWEMINTKSGRLRFSEAIDPASVTLRTTENRIISITANREQVHFTLAEPIDLGQSISLGGRVQDLSGNSTRFSIHLWAKNPTPATLLINEFTTKGTEANPDRVELLVTGRGNLAGLTLYVGTPSQYSDRYIFGDQWVEHGTYLVVRIQVSESDATPHVSEKEAGLSANNGCLTIARSPEREASLLDAVVWGNMTTSTFEGFGSKELLAQVQGLYQCGQWSSTNSRDSVDSTHSTATRSFCRDAQKDTNSAQDWYICDTREASFGTANSQKRYTN